MRLLGGSQRHRSLARNVRATLAIELQRSLLFLERKSRILLWQMGNTKLVHTHTHTSIVLSRHVRLHLPEMTIAFRRPAVALRGRSLPQVSRARLQSSERRALARGRGGAFGPSRRGRRPLASLAPHPATGRPSLRGASQPAGVNPHPSCALWKAASERRRRLKSGALQLH